MLRFLVDESCGLRLAEKLREEGFEAESVIDLMRSAKNGDVLDKAFAEKRILVTNDKDFGELVYRSRRHHGGVILLRLENDTPQNRLDVVRKVIDAFGEKLQNSFVVATEKKTRIRTGFK